MAAQPTDKLRKGFYGSPTTISASISNTVQTIPLSSTTGLPTDTGIDIVIDRVDANGNKTPSKQETLTLTISGTNGTLAMRGVEGTAQAHASGAVVEVLYTAATHNAAVDWGLAQHNQDGSHSAITATSITTPTATITNLTATNLTLTGSNTTAGWTPVGQSFTYTGNNGNKEYTGTFPADMTSTLSPGMRMQLTRSTTAPIQSMAFTAASSQYATKATPSGLSFTAAFTCEAWVYLTSYGGNPAGIISRSDNTSSGFGLGLTTAGQLQVWYYASSGNFTGWITNQSIPLGRWVHVASVVSSTSSKTLQGMYINGVSVATTQNAAAAASLTQGSANLSVGAVGAGISNTFISGNVSEARVWSAAQTQSAIQANMDISLTGSETNLVALFQGNGNFNDKTSNANNLTASGGAIATQAANPYNNVEYAIVTKVGSYSGGVTPVTVFTGTDYNIPNMTLTSPQYSTQRVPFGFPGQTGKWALTFPINSNQDKTTSLARYILQNPNGLNFSLPTGAWKVKGQLSGVISFSTSQTFNHIGMMLSPNTTVDMTNSLPFSKLYCCFDLPPSTSEVDSPVMFVEDAVEVSTMTPYYVLAGSLSASISLVRVANTSSVTFESAYI